MIRVQSLGEHGDGQEKVVASERPFVLVFARDDFLLEVLVLNGRLKGAIEDLKAKPVCDHAALESQLKKRLEFHCSVLRNKIQLAQIRKGIERPGGDRNAYTFAFGCEQLVQPGFFCCLKHAVVL